MRSMQFSPYSSAAQQRPVVFADITVEMSDCWDSDCIIDGVASESRSTVGVSLNDVNLNIHHPEVHSQQILCRPLLLPLASDCKLFSGQQEFKLTLAPTGP